MKGHFEIPHKISYPYIWIYDFYAMFGNAPLNYELLNHSWYGKICREKIASRL